MDSPRPAPELPPGFRFHPTDEELVVHYLKCKLASMPLPVSIIAEINLYKYDPWDLPAKASFGEKEWYFFSPRDRKYPNGARPNRAAASGYWKATGTDKPIFTRSSSSKVGVKKALVFYRGKPPKGIKTNWIMHEYRLTTTTDTSARSTLFHPRKTLRLDDWVLCRIYKKAQAPKQEEEDSFTVAEQIPPPSSTMNDNYYPKLPFFPRLGSFGSLFPLDDQHPTYTNIDTFFMDMNTNPSTETTTNTATATATATTRPASEMLPCLIPSKGETEEGGIEYGFRGIGGERNYIDGFGNLMHKNAFIPTNLQPNMLQWPFLDSRCTI